MPNKTCCVLKTRGSGQEVGRSCHLLTFKGKKILFDFGIHPGMQSAEALPMIDFIDCESIDILLVIIASI
uniref:MBL fold metallo-hydrolase n=1 Tax=Steinernema glaseri TaxID=37863 RepID=A0A1I7ZZH8_9BILA